MATAITDTGKQPQAPVPAAPLRAPIAGCTFPLFLKTRTDGPARVPSTEKQSTSQSKKGLSLSESRTCLPACLNLLGSRTRFPAGVAGSSGAAEFP